MAFEFSPGPTALASGQVQVAISTMAAKVAVQPGLKPWQGEGESLIV